MTTIFGADDRVGVGFGVAMLLCDGEQIWSEGNRDWPDLLTGAQAEQIAATDPDHEWRIVLEAPLSSAVYQRSREGAWVLIESGPGFA